MKPFIVFIFLTVGPIGYGNAQQLQHDTTSCIKPSLLKANLNLFGASMNYEMKVAAKTTVNFEGGFTGSFKYYDTNNPYWGYFISPVLSTELRQYYIIEKRLRKNRTLRNNSASFYSLTMGYRFPPLAQKNMVTGITTGNDNLSFSSHSNLFITPAWGLQRSLVKKINFEGRFGFSLQYFPEFRKWSGTPSIRIGFGYVIK